MLPGAVMPKATPSALQVPLLSRLVCESAGRPPWSIQRAQRWPCGERGPGKQPGCTSLFGRRWGSAAGGQGQVRLGLHEASSSRS